MSYITHSQTVDMEARGMSHVARPRFDTTRKRESLARTRTKNKHHEYIDLHDRDHLQVPTAQLV